MPASSYIDLHLHIFETSFILRLCVFNLPKFYFFQFRIFSPLRTWGNTMLDLIVYRRHAYKFYVQHFYYDN